MKLALMTLLVLLCLSLLALKLWRLADHRADRQAMQALLATQPATPQRFTPDLVAALPEPARRYFTYTIAEGTPLYTVAEIEMTGKFGLGDQQDPKYLPMQARQILAVPQGFVWKMSAGSGLMQVSGSDSGSWTRFWLAGLTPVARTGGTQDHARSAFGRMLSEGVFWTPAALLPRPGVVWEATGSDQARVTLSHEGFRQSVDISVAKDGRPTAVILQRWSNANPDKLFRLQPFGGTMSEFRNFSGFTLPTRVEGGNFYGTDAYFPFFMAEVTALRFPASPLPD